MSIEEIDQIRSEVFGLVSHLGLLYIHKTVFFAVRM